MRCSYATPVLFADSLRRVTAWISIALVLALTLLAVCPQLHARLHGGLVHSEPETASHGCEGGDDLACDQAETCRETGCIVSLFQQGIQTAVALMPALCPDYHPEGVPPCPLSVDLLTCERRLRPPSHAPPRA